MIAVIRPTAPAPVPTTPAWDDVLCDDLVSLIAYYLAPTQPAPLGNDVASESTALRGIREDSIGAAIKSESLPHRFVGNC